MVAKIVIVSSGKDHQSVLFAGAEGAYLFAHRGQCAEGRVYELSQVQGRVGVEEIARHHDQGGVVGIAQEVQEFSDRPTGDVRGGREGDVADHVHVMAVGDGDRTSFSPCHPSSLAGIKTTYSRRQKH